MLKLYEVEVIRTCWVKTTVQVEAVSSKGAEHLAEIKVRQETKLLSGCGIDEIEDADGLATEFNTKLLRIIPPEKIQKLNRKMKRIIF